MHPRTNARQPDFLRAKFVFLRHGRSPTNRQLAAEVHKFNKTAPNRTSLCDTHLSDTELLPCVATKADALRLITLRMPFCKNGLCYCY